jgi:RimJ/RimL family protein N-acetyltransferase
MLKSNKVLLRPVQKSDISIFLKWYNDLEVLEYLSMYLPMTETMEEKWLEEAASGQNGTKVHFVIEAIEGKKSRPIGSIGLNKIDHRCQTAEMGIAIGEKEYWNKGYGTEAARLLINVRIGLTPNWIARMYPLGSTFFNPINTPVSWS